MSVNQIILRKLGFLDKIFCKKKKTISLSNKVYKDLKVKKARYTSPTIKKAFDTNKLLCDNTTKTHHINRSDFFKKNLAF